MLIESIQTNFYQFWLFKIISVALQALKRKKRYEQQLTSIDGTLTTLEYQRETLENAHTNAEVLKVMGQAAQAFKGANNELWASEKSKLNNLC